MDEMCQDLGMPGVLKNAGRPIRSIEAFHHRWCAKILMRLVERDRCGADRHKKSLRLDKRYVSRKVTSGRKTNVDVEMVFAEGQNPCLWFRESP
jgi:hypothetical protein